MLSKAFILSFVLSGVFASSPGPRRLHHDVAHKHAHARNSNVTGTPTIHGRTVGVPVTPADWPTTTQAGAIPSITAVNAADPNLISLSYALNNAGNSLFTTKYTGDLTYYATGQTSCGDVQVDTSYTAAVSHLMYDTWPGVTANPNRNPICGPWTAGREAQSSSGAWVTTVASSDGTMQIGGDGLPNCLAGSKCHVPMTATVTNPATGLSVVVAIVDRCEACALGDIDLTTTAFSAIADINSGRVHGIQWSFNAMGGGSPPPGTTTSVAPTTSKVASSTSTKVTTSTSTSSTAVVHTTTSVASGGACAGVAAWSSSAVYTGGMTATYGGFLWTASWWTEADVPGGPAGVWVKGAAC